MLRVNSKIGIYCSYSRRMRIQVCVVYVYVVHVCSGSVCMRPLQWIQILQ